MHLYIPPHCAGEDNFVVLRLLKGLYQTSPCNKRIAGDGRYMTNEDVLHWLERTANVLHENRVYLTELDSAIGDADHGINMDRGFSAVRSKFPSMATMDTSNQLKTVASTLISTVGGASGPLYGTAFLRAGAAVAGKQDL